MANTTNFNLYKPNRADNTVDVDTSLADNFTKIDTELQNNKGGLEAHINNLNAHTSENVSHADGSVKTMLDNHDQRLTSLSTTNTDLVLPAISDHGTRLTDLEPIVEGHTASIEGIDSRVTDIETLGLDKLAPNVEGRISTLESDVEGFLAPATFDAMDQQSYTFDEYRIGYVDSKLVHKETKNKLYKKSIFKQLPLMFPDYQSIVTQEGSTYIYPQSFTIDWDNREIFVLYSTSGGSSTKRWIVVFNLDTQAYKSCFNAGDAGGEGIVVKKEGADRYLYVKTTGKSIGKFLLNTLPTNKSTISPVSTYDVGLFYNFSYRNGTWMVEQDNAAVGTNIRRTSFSFYDDNFQLKGTTSISTGEGGFWTGNYVNYIPKRQGIALGDGFIVQSTGGYYGKGTTPTPYTYHGIKILNVKGQLVSEGILDPSLMIPMLEAKGIVCGRIEGEGVHVAPNGDIYSIVIHQDRFMSEANTTGIIIFKELSEDKDAIDFSSTGKVYTGFNPTVLETGVFPRSGDGKMYDPLTGALLDTLDKILDFMIGTDLRRFAFYSSSVTVNDISGTAIPTAKLVSIHNANSSTFFVDYYNDPVCDKFIIFGSSGSRTQKRIGNPSNTTANRPSSPYVGMPFFDTTLNKPIWCKSISPNVWVDATGATV